MQQYFFDLADHVKGALRGSEVFLANYSGEESDFVRFNRSLIRQAMSVTQRYMGLDLIDARRHAKASITLSGQAGLDRARLDALMADLRSRLPQLPEDPYLLYSTEVHDTHQAGDDRLPPRDDVLANVERIGRQRDLVGLYTAGGIFAGFANSLGQRNWFGAYSFGLDWTFYHSADKAVKVDYAAFQWDEPAFGRKVDAALEQLAILGAPARTIRPGRYRVHLAASALKEIVGILDWGGYGLKAHRTRFTPLLKMIAEGAVLSPSVSLRENTAEGIAPNFQSAGYVKPPSVTLIEAGRYRDCLACPRSAKEYGLPCNAANDGEAPESLDMSCGDIPAAEALARLGEGVSVNSLWYLNYSDRSAGRITGMTRFGTYWVEGGRAVAPLNVMRFDETVYRVLGENLLALTKEREFFPSTGTYGGRQTDSIRLPAALVKDFTLTL